VDSGSQRGHLCRNIKVTKSFQQHLQLSCSQVRDLQEEIKSGKERFKALVDKLPAAFSSWQPDVGKLKLVHKDRLYKVEMELIVEETGMKSLTILPVLSFASAIFDIACTVFCFTWPTIRFLVTNQFFSNTYIQTFMQQN